MVVDTGHPAMRFINMLEAYTYYRTASKSSSTDYDMEISILSTQ